MLVVFSPDFIVIWCSVAIYNSAKYSCHVFPLLLGIDLVPFGNFRHVKFSFLMT